MKHLNICTGRYSQLLKDFASAAREAGLCHTCGGSVAGGLFTLNCQYSHPGFAQKLMDLLTHIVLLEHPIYQNSQKMKDMAGDLKGTALYAATLRDLSRFIKHNRSLNLEGYMAFRMSDYKEKLDMMSYSLIKKMKLAQKD